MKEEWRKKLTKLDFDNISDTDIKKVLDKIPQTYSIDKYIHSSVEYVSKRLAITDEHKEVYVLITLLQRFNIQEFDFSKISNTTLEVLLKPENRNIRKDMTDLKMHNFIMHSYKFKLFENYLKSGGKGEVNSQEINLTLNKTMAIHIDIALLIVKKYNITKISALFIVDDINKIRQNKIFDPKSGGMEFIGARILILDKKVRKVDFAYFMLNSKQYNRILFYNNIILKNYETTLQGKQLEANRVYFRAVSNASKNNNNSFGMKLEAYIPKVVKNKNNINISIDVLT